MEHATTHYSNAQKPGDLFRWAKEAAASIVSRFQHTADKPVLVYRGMSGVASATALAMVLADQYPEFPFGMMYVRKEGESSHGRSDYEAGWTTGTYTWSVGWKPGHVAIFVDDCIDSGKTMGLCLQAAATQGKLDISQSYRILSNSISGALYPS